MAFIAVSICLLVLRKREPGRARGFRTPLAWIIAPLAILGCAYLFWSLPRQTQLYFLAWNVLGFVLYVVYARRNSMLGKA